MVPKARTPSHVAIDIFVDTNQSSATIRRFDLVVALAEQDYGEDLRRRIGDWHDTHEVFHSYFSADEGRYIPEIGEWALKVACLRAKSEKHPFGLPPKGTALRYSAVLAARWYGHRKRGASRVFAGRSPGNPRPSGTPWRRQLEGRYLPGRRFMSSQHFGPTYVQSASQRGRTQHIVWWRAYLWRSFVTDRYEAQANDRLFEDCVGLKECLDENQERMDECRICRRRLMRHNIPFPQRTAW